MLGLDTGFLEAKDSLGCFDPTPTPTQVVLANQLNEQKLKSSKSS
jgi:hypothetical protein